MHDNIIKTQIFHNVKFDLKCHLRSHKVTFMFKNQIFLEYVFCLKSDLFKTFSE